MKRLPNGEWYVDLWGEVDDKPAGPGVVWEGRGTRRLAPPPFIPGVGSFTCCGSCGSRARGDFCDERPCPRKATEQGPPWWAGRSSTTTPRRRRRWWQKGQT